MGDELVYFGYGANRSGAMVHAITGRLPLAASARLDGYELCIQTWDEIPPDVRGTLTERGWSDMFRAYCIRKADGKSVSGTAWNLTQQERDLVSEWDMCGRWYAPVGTSISLDSGELVTATTEMIDDPKIRQSVEGDNYLMFLNNKAQMVRTAIAVRGRYNIR